MARKKIFVDTLRENTIEQVWEMYTASQTAKGVSDITLRNYKHYCAIYDADIAKNYDRVSPLAQIQKPRNTIKI